MKKLNKDSKDLIKQNILDLEKIFPEAVKEGVVDFTVLKELLSNKSDETDNVEKYEFTWAGKKNALRIAQTGTTGTLLPDKENSKNWDTTENLYIEGDNLEVLKILQRSYYGKVNVIYIDPPYNTGEDFVYKDNYKDNIANYLKLTGQIDEDGNKFSTNSETDGRYHTNWLNMMYPRLKLARNLLSDDGVIFISIDDNEQENLKKICNEIFGERNFVGMFSVENNPKGRKNSKFISATNDYCIVFAKNKDISYFIENIPKEKNSLKKDDKTGKYYTSGKRVIVGKSSNKLSEFNSVKHYSVYYNETKNEIKCVKEKTFDDKNNTLINNGFKRYVSYDNGFLENTYTKEKFIELFENNALIFKNDSIYEKDFNLNIRIKSLLVNKIYNTIVKNKPVKIKHDFKTETAGTDLKKLGIPFTMPKNISFLKVLFSLFEKTNKRFVVLDFFSGSATTAHAVMQLNAEDGGNRKFIMVQLPESTSKDSEAYKAGYKTIADIGRERIRRAGDKIIADNPAAKDLDIGFKAFKLDSSNIKEWEPSFMENGLPLSNLVDSFVEGRSNEDILTEIILKSGFELTVDINEIKVDTRTIYNVGKGRLFVVLDEKIDVAISEELIKVSKENPDIKPIAVFKDVGFINDSTKINIALNLEAAGFSEILSI